VQSQIKVHGMWMSSMSFVESRFNSIDEGRYAHFYLSSLRWWEMMHFVLKGVEPLYAFLHFADQDKIPILSKVLLRFHMCTSMKAFCMTIPVILTNI
jgi:hypothetical protein